MSRDNDRETHPFVRVRYANTSGLDSDVQVRVHHTPQGSDPQVEDAFTAPRTVPDRQHEEIGPTDLRLPQGSLIQQVELTWDPQGSTPPSALTIVLNPTVTDFETLMVTQGPDYVVAACLAGNGSCIGENRRFP